MNIVLIPILTVLTSGYLTYLLPYSNKYWLIWLGLVGIGCIIDAIMNRLKI